MQLLLIRHGQSVANAEGRIQGQGDFPLSERGREQARALAARLVREGWSVSVLYASDLSRAAETAQILAASLNAPVKLDARLREYELGVVSGLLWEEFESRYAEIWHTKQRDDVWLPIPGEEGDESFAARAAAALADMRARHADEECAAVVAHGGSLGMILAHLLGIAPRRPLPFNFANASLSIAEVTSKKLRLCLVNDTCHLNADLR